MPCLILRQSSEVVGMNKEFKILTGWKQEILLGHAPNTNINTGPFMDTNRASPILSQEPAPRPHAVSVLELMNQASGPQYLTIFADRCYQNPHSKGHRRMNLFRYLTQEDIGHIADIRANSANAVSVKLEPFIKQEYALIHQGKTAIRVLSVSEFINATIMPHTKHDSYNISIFIVVQISPSFLHRLSLTNCLESSYT
jgi:hypothetical protein